MKSKKWFELQNALDGIDLTVTMEGTGSATAKLFPDGKIVVDATAAQAAKYVNLSTPFGIKVLDAHSIHGNDTACKWAIANTTDDIISAVNVADSDTDIDRAADLNDAYQEFAADDNDLRIDIGVAAFTGLLVIDVQFT